MPAEEYKALNPWDPWAPTPNQIAPFCRGDGLALFSAIRSIFEGFCYREVNQEELKRHIKELKKLLVKGYNPNERVKWDPASNMQGVNGFEEAILIRRSLEPQGFFKRYRETYNLIIRLFLVYGVDPSRPNPPYCSAIQMAAQYKQQDLIQLIDSLRSTERPLTTVTNSTVVYDSAHNEINTTLEFKGDHAPVYTTVRRLDHELPPEEKSAFLDLFKNFYQIVENTDTITIEELFGEDFKPERDQDKYYESIFIIEGGNKRVIGLYSFSTLHCKNNYVIAQGEHLLIDTPFRRLGIAAFIMFRPGYAMKLLTPLAKVGIFFCAATLNGYLQARGLVHYPMNKKASTQCLVKAILKQVYGEAVIYHEDETMLAYFEEKHPIQAKEVQNARSAQNPGMKLYETFFKVDILDSKTGKGVPVLCDVSKRNLDALERRNGFCFFKGVQQFAGCFLELQQAPRRIFQPSNQRLLSKL